jgi:hypothetical protein
MYLLLSAVLKNTAKHKNYNSKTSSLGNYKINYNMPYIASTYVTVK